MFCFPSLSLSLSSSHSLRTWTEPHTGRVGGGFKLDTAVSDKHEKTPSDLPPSSANSAGDLWSREEESRGTAAERELTLLISRVGPAVWIPLFRCRRRCPDLIKCLIAFPSRLHFRRIEAEQPRLPSPPSLFFFFPCLTKNSFFLPDISPAVSYYWG